jgi:serine/threonine protein kinase
MSDAAETRPTLPGIDLLEAIVRTNLSDVWKGVRRSDGAAVVIKFAAAATDPEMLRQEAQTVEALEEAGVRGVIPARFESLPVPHLVLPWKGRALREVLEAIRGGDDRSRATDMFFKLVEIVSKVHAEGFLHGDLKPENVIVDGEGRPWLTDFGMARAIHSVRLDTHISSSLSRSEGGWGGTLHYLPPEGLQGEAPTQSWDVYALGVMLHEVLLGSRPDRAATPESLRTVLPGEVVQVLLDALAYSPKDRIRSARVLLGRLQEIRTELTATGPSRWFLRGGRVALAGIAAFFVALRYGSVFTLVAGYLAILGSAIVLPPILIAFIPFLLLHVTIRWEGPETQQEAALRKSGGLFRRR